MSVCYFLMSLENVQGAKDTTPRAQAGAQAGARLARTEHAHHETEEETEDLQIREGA